MRSAFKPIPHTEVWYDYHECVDWIERKYNFSTEDPLKSGQWELEYIKVSGAWRPSDTDVFNISRPSQRASYPWPQDGVTWVFCIAGEVVSEKQWRQARAKREEWDKKFETWLKDNPRPPRHSFWQYLRNHYDLHKEIILSRKTQFKEDWVKDIVFWLIDEFDMTESGYMTIRMNGEYGRQERDY